MLSFPADKSTQLTFKVGVAGTQMTPSKVSVVLERDGKMLSFAADKAKVGEDWVAIIEQPGTVFPAGDVKLSVNVVINNRLFTPLKSSAEIVPEATPDVSTVSQVEPELEIQAEPDVAPPAEPEIQEEVPVEAVPEVQEQVVPDPVTEVIPPAQEEGEKKKKIKDLLIKAQADANSASVPVKKSIKRFVKPRAQEVKKINAEAIKELFASVQVDTSVKKNDSPNIKMGLLKTIEPINEKNVDEPVIVEREISAPASTSPSVAQPIFSIKKLGTKII